MALSGKEINIMETLADRVLAVERKQADLEQEMERLRRRIPRLMNYLGAAIQFERDDAARDEGL